MKSYWISCTVNNIREYVFVRVTKLRVWWSCHLLVSFCLSVRDELRSGQFTFKMHFVDALPQASQTPSSPHKHTFRMHNTSHRPFYPLFLHIKNAALLSLAAHAARPTRLWGLTADTPPSVSSTEAICSSLPSGYEGGSAWANLWEFTSDSTQNCRVIWYIYTLNSHPVVMLWLTGFSTAYGRQTLSLVSPRRLTFEVHTEL